MPTDKEIKKEFKLKASKDPDKYYATSVLADRFGTRKLMIFGALLALVWAVPFFRILQGAQAWWLAIIPMQIAMCSYYGGVSVMMIKAVKQHIRYSSIGLMHGLTFAIFAGTAPLIAMMLIHMTGWLWSPGLYLIVGALISLLTTLTLKG